MHPESPRRSLRFHHFGLENRGVGRIDEKTDRRRSGHQFVQQLETLCG